MDNFYQKTKRPPRPPLKAVMFGLMLGVMLVPMFTYAYNVPFTGTASKSRSDFLISGTISMPELASGSAPISTLGYFTAGDIAIVLMIFVLIMLELLTIWFRKV